MSFVMMWDGPDIREPERGTEIRVSTTAELDAALRLVSEQAANDGQAYAVQIYRDGSDAGLIFGVGHDERSFVSWVDNEARHGSRDATAYESGLTDAPRPAAFDFFGTYTEVDAHRMRVTPRRAHEAAREYVETGQRPRCLEWE